MVDLAMGYYDEHPTIVGRSVCKSWCSGLRTLPTAVQAITIWPVQYVVIGNIVQVGIRNSDIISVGTDSFAYGQSSLRVWILSGHILPTLLCFFMNLSWLYPFHYYSKWVLSNHSGLQPVCLRTFLLSSLRCATNNFWGTITKARDKAPEFF